jgi:hypothetical protein
MLQGLGLDHAIDRCDVALVQRDEYRTLVGEILIHRAGTHPATSATRPVVTAATPSRFSNRTTASSTASTVGRARPCCGRRRDVLFSDFIEASTRDM